MDNFPLLVFYSKSVTRLKLHIIMYEMENSILNWAIRWTRITSKDMTQSQYVSKLVQALVYVGIISRVLVKITKILLVFVYCILLQ